MIKMEKKLQKICFTHYYLLITQEMWQADYQILSIIFLKELIKLNVNTDTMIKKCETCITKYKYCDCFHNLHNDLPFLPEMMKIENWKNLQLICMIKLNILFT